MRGLFFDPYLDSLGGGERYMLTLIEALNHQRWETVLLWDDQSIASQAQRKFNINISSTAFQSTELINRSLMSKWQNLRDFDLVFLISDGSLPFLFGKQNIVHLQVPFQNVSGGSFLNKLKQTTIDNFVVNSQFTKQIVDPEYGIISQVIYPPVDVDELKPAQKQNAILFSARFSNLLQQKSHHVLITAFKNLYETGMTNYELWLAGSTEVGSEELLNQLRYQAKGLPIKIYTDLEWGNLLNLYAKAKFYWSAVGYEVDEHTEPEKCEHFGISIVEAMAAGCIPIVINKGGYKEIVINERNGYVWNNLEELLNITTGLINNEDQVMTISKVAQTRARDFSKSKFVNSFLKIIKGN